MQILSLHRGNSSLTCAMGIHDGINPGVNVQGICLTSKPPPDGSDDASRELALDLGHQG